MMDSARWTSDAWSDVLIPLHRELWVYPRGTQHKCAVRDGPWLTHRDDEVCFPTWLDHAEPDGPVTDMAGLRHRGRCVGETLPLCDAPHEVGGRKHARLLGDAKAGASDRVVDRRARGSVGGVGDRWPGSGKVLAEPDTLDQVSESKAGTIRREIRCLRLHHQKLPTGFTFRSWGLDCTPRGHQ